MSRVLTEIFRTHVARDGDHPAVIDGDRRLSYAELDAASDAAAVALAARGVGPGDRVALVLPRSADLIVCVLAVLKCGAAYALLDPNWPAARVALLAARLQSPLVVDPATAADLASGAGRPPAVPATEDDLAAVVFTSGTTGEPKGVLVPHRALARLLPRAGDFDLGERPVMALSAAVPWDAMAFELWGAIGTGGTSVVVRDPYLMPSRLRELTADHGLNTLIMATSIFNLHVDEDPDAFLGVQQVMVGGEQLSTDHVRRFLTRHPGIHLINGYGPSENGICTTLHRLTVEQLATGRVPIGVPIAGTDVHLLDGEICISGDGLAHGYLADDRTTADRFVERTVDGTTVRLYRTGDLGTRGPDGLLYFGGRVDRQLKVRGHRIEPAEIERTAETLDGVTRAVVVVLRDTGGAVSGLALAYTGVAPEQRVMAELRAALPTYLTPQGIRQVESFPLKANGKVDDAAMEEWFERVPLPEGEPPRTPDEQAVADAFGDVLGLSQVSRQSNFFDLGGDSLRAGRVCVRLGATVGLTVPVAVVLGHPDVAELAVKIAELRDRRADGDDVTSVRPAAPAGAVPLLPSQIAQFLRAQIDPKDVSALCPLVWDYEGELDAEVLRAALGDLAARHEALRSSYVMLDVPAAQVAPELDRIPLTRVEESRDVLAALLLPLDLEGGEVWRAVLAPGRLGLVVHHVALDGWAAAVLAEDLSTAYQARQAGREPDFGVRAPGLAEIAEADAGQRAIADRSAQRDYWRRALEGAEDLSVPAGDGPPGLAAVLRDVDRASLEEAVRVQGVTETVVLLSAYAAAANRLTGQSDLVVGVPVARRTTGLADRAVACLMETVCVRLAEPGTSGVRRSLLTALANQDVPGHEVQRLSRRRPPYRVVAVVQDNPVPTLELPGTATKFVWTDTDQLDTDLLVELLPGGVLRISHQQDAVSGEFAVALAEGIVEEIGRMR